MDNIIETPCISICRYDEAGKCIGCGRTNEEIVNWIDYTPEERKTIMDRLEQEINDSFD